VGLGKYLKKAFLNHWNLLVFLGASGFALLSGHPDVYIPLVLAGEAAYVGVVGTHPKFQRHVDSQETRRNRAQGSVLAAEAFQRVVKSLPPRQLRRFEALRERCAALRQIAQQMRASEELTAGDEPLPLEDLQLSGLDRLLWIYLRLLHTQDMLNRFFERTDEQQIRDEIGKLEERIRRMPTDTVPGSPSRQTIKKTLEDNLETCRGRLENLLKARENSELVEAEIERLENKIRSITELAINRQDPGFVSGQVDQVADGLVQTERTMNEIRFATGLEPFDDAAPTIMPRGPAVDVDPGIHAGEVSEEPRPRGRQREDGISYL
jgi:hypothetical protein